MKYILLAIINLIYGVLLLLTLSSDTPGFYIVLTIGGVLTIMGLAGCLLAISFYVRNARGKADDSQLKGWFSLIKSLDIVLVLGLLFRAFIIQPFIVDGASMEGNFHNNEAILVDKISFHFKPLDRGDVIIFQAPKSPTDDYIKRIIGLPGETVSISDGRVYVNNKLMKEPYLASGLQTLTSTNGSYQITLGSDQYFVMGDNRSNSSDSRDWGPVPKINIIGRAWLVVYPWNLKGIVHNGGPILEAYKIPSNYSVTNLSNLIKFNYLHA